MKTNIRFSSIRAALAVLVFTAMQAVLLGTCASSPKPAAPDSSSGKAMDTAIEEAAVRIDNAFNAGTEIALISVSSPSIQFSEYVLSYLETVLVNSGKLAVVDRANLDKIRAEQGFQLSDEVSDASAKDIGNLLGAEAIVTGSLVDLGDVQRLNIKSINVETAKIAAAYVGDIANNARVQTLLASGRGAASNGGTAPAVSEARPAAQVQVTQPPSVNKTYQIGDTGPAGGIVFFDMGFKIDGWQYLEAAPLDFPTKVIWASTLIGLSMLQTDTGVGTGTQNTARVLSALKKAGEAMRAAQVVGVFEYGGYDDWFLPSKDELNLMYENLKKKRIGGFSNDTYWSSSGYGDWAAWQTNFSDGSQIQGGVTMHPAEGLVRAVRRF
jgi:hypothetical protein